MKTGGETRPQSAWDSAGHPNEKSRREAKSVLLHKYQKRAIHEAFQGGPPASKLCAPTGRRRENQAGGAGSSRKGNLADRAMGFLKRTTAARFTSTKQACSTAIFRNSAQEPE